MPSFHDADLTIANPVEVPTGATAPEDVLSRVKSEGLRRRNRRHRRNSALAVLGIAIAAVPAVALLPDGGGDAEDVTVAAEGDANEGRPTTSVARRPVTSLTTATTTVETLPPTTVVQVEGGEAVLIPPTSVVRPPRPTTTVPPPTTAPAPTCRNSTDPACGAFRWDPEPAPNAALSIGFVDPTTTAAVGEEVVFNVVWSDADATLTYDNFSAEGVGLGRACTQEARFGPWTPPEPAGGSGDLVYRHTFTEAGTYTVVVSAGTADCNTPYGNDATTELTVTVQ